MTAPSSSPPKGSPLRTWLPWALLLVVVVGLLAYGSQGRTGDLTAQDRVTNLARTIRCPQCGGESTAESNAVASQEIRREIARQVEQGRTDDEIRGYFAANFGEDVLLTPPSTGVGSLVWILPIVAAAVAVVGLVLVFRKWSRDGGEAEVTDADRELVAEALREREDGDVHGEGASR